MKTGRMPRLAELMGRMADGERSAPFALYEEFGGEIGAAVRFHAQRLGAGRLAGEDVDGLVVDVCLMLAERAGSWDATGGAVPWTWAGRRIAAMVGRFVGQRAEALDDGLEAGPVDTTPSAADRHGLDALALLDGLAVSDELAALLRDALRAATSERNALVLLEVRLQAWLGDPSPSVTVGRDRGLSPAAVRQVCKRATDRLDAVVRSDPRFAPLGGATALLSGERRSARPARPAGSGRFASEDRQALAA